MQKEFLFFMCLVVVLTGVYNKPTYKSGIRTCFKQECPENTYACEKFSRIFQEDKSKLVNNIRCLNLEGQSLKNITTYDNNPFSPDTDFKGYSYTGAFQITTNDSNENAGSNENSEKENTNYGKGNSKDSEVEDLTR